MNSDEFIEYVEKYLKIEDAEVAQDKVDFFKTLDENGDQELTLEEIKGYYTEMGACRIPLNTIKAAIALSDSNKDGKIQKSEFARLYRLLEASEVGDFKEVLFTIADKNQDGTVKKHELEALIATLGWEMPETLPEAMGQQDFAEFVGDKLQ